MEKCSIGSGSFAVVGGARTLNGQPTDVGLCGSWCQLIESYLITPEKGKLYTPLVHHYEVHVLPYPSIDKTSTLILMLYYKSFCSE